MNARGIFPAPANKGLAFRTRRRVKGMRQIDRFAELLAQHGPGDTGGHVGKCAERMGLSREEGNSILQKMRKDLGWQAR